MTPLEQKIKEHYGVGEDKYYDLPSSPNPDVWVRVEDGKFYLMKASEGFCEMIPMNIESIDDLFKVIEIFSIK